MTDLIWRKSSYTDNGTCVEVAKLPDGRRFVRQSNDPTGAVVEYTGAEWDAFIAGVRAGEFD